MTQRIEIEKILSCIKNQKHQLLIALAYGAGLRISEVINLRVLDIDFGELTLHLKEAKGKKDRITILPEKLKNGLLNLTAGKKNNDYVFVEPYLENYVIKFMVKKSSQIKTLPGNIFFA